jgi:hypothetical protein
MPSASVQTKVQAAGASKSATKPSADTRDAYVTPHFGDLGVDLPALKVKQRLDKGRWVTEI